MAADPNAAPTSAIDGRPTRELPLRQLVQMSLYWFGLSSIFAGLTAIMGGRLEFTGLVGPGEAGRALFATTIGGALIAVLVQPTIGSISDYTTSRWGRRKPYILIGSLLDVVFLVGIALSNNLISIAAFITLLQFSSNFAQGPFQGYVPDLIPRKQVGLASALVGLFQILGNVGGFAIGAIAISTKQFELGLIALGVVEVATMLGVFFGVREGTTPKARNGRSWRSIAAEAWGTDVLRERSFLWLVASRLAILMAGGVLVNLAVFYLRRAQGLTQEQTGTAYLVMVGLVAIATVIAVVPSARISDRVGRKKVIYASCALGAVGLGIVALAPSLPIVYAGVAIYGLSAGIFLAVDWALMTDIIPKASSGRYMGMSNVATASAGVLAVALGGTLMDIVGGPSELGSGPRAALVFAVALCGLGALLLRPVDERRREDLPSPAGSDRRVGEVAVAV
jgi:MFS family permease